MYSGCTGGFIGRSRSDGRLYQFTAGHCKTTSTSNWLSNFATGSPHIIGPLSKSVFGLSGDVGIISINNPSGWNPHAWILVRDGGGGVTSTSVYPIRSDSVGIVGMRVCVAGASGNHTNCGRIARTGVTVTYNDDRTTVSGLLQASTCVYPGDSGGPMFSYNVAYGIISGGTRGPIPGNGCITLAQPILTAENLMNVGTSHEAG